MLLCPLCRKAIPESKHKQTTPITCESCHGVFEVTVFPALYTDDSPSHGESIVSAEDSACYYHPEKKAVIACNFCGCFICSLCDVEIGKQHLCPNCLAKGKDASQASEIIKGYTLHDVVAYTLALVPLVIFFFVTCITAPLTLIYIWLNRKKPLGLIPRNRWRFWVAGIAATLQIIGWCVAGVIYFGS